jgi:hypothetical protein
MPDTTTRSSVTFTLDPQALAVLRERARLEDRSMASVVRRAVHRELMDDPAPRRPVNPTLAERRD